MGSGQVWVQKVLAGIRLVALCLCWSFFLNLHELHRFLLLMFKWWKLLKIELFMEMILLC